MEAPKSRTWSFSFSVTRAEPDGSGETAAHWTKSFTRLDVALLAGALILFCLEPVAVYLFLTHHGGLKSAESCAAGSNVVVVHQPVDAPSLGGEELAGHGSDVITPLNVRDPSALVMGPAPSLPQAIELPPPPASESGEDWRKVLREAAKTGAARASLPKPKPKLDD